MAARTVTVRGVSADEVAAFRQQLAAGRRPRVVFTEAAGQMAGQVGQVVSLRDPAESDEFVVVRFGRDELPFSPADLQVAPRGVRKAVSPPAPETVPEPVRPPEPEFVLDMPAAKAAPPAVTPQSGPPATPKPALPAAPATAAASVPAPRKAASGRSGKPKPPAGLTVTLAYADGEWT